MEQSEHKLLVLIHPELVEGSSKYFTARKIFKIYRLINFVV